MKKNLIIIALLTIVAAGCGRSTKYDSRQDDVIMRQDLFNTSMKENVSCFRIPSIVTAPNGDLIAAIDERVLSCADLIGGRDINTVIRRSSDNGVTWGPIETVADFPDGKSCSDPSMIVDNVTKEVFLFYNFMDHDNAHGIYRLHVMRSKDNGETWTGPEDITPQITDTSWRQDFMFITSGRGTQTSDGTLLHTLVNLQHGLHVFGSDDHGATWHLFSDALKPGDESKIVELPDGRWMINCRLNKALGRQIYVSDDRGKTWDSWNDTTLADPGCNAGIINYTSKAKGSDKDRLLFVNANDTSARRNLTVKISYDCGKTWSEGKTIYSGEAAYSSMTVLQNGDIAVLYEKDDYTNNELVVFSLEWLTDGKDKYIHNKK